MERRSSILLIAGGTILLAALLAPGQDGRQQWKLSRGSGDRVQFTIERWQPGNRWSTSTDVAFDRFRGLSSTAFSRGGPAKFEYVQDAGRLICQGDFSWGRGSGTFTFAPDPGFVAELKKLGYDAPTQEQLFSMVLMDVGVEFARSVQDAGLHADTRQLIDLRVHGVTTDYVRDTQRSGYRNLGAKDYIDMKIHGVEPSFLRDLKDAGYELSSREVVELKIHGVSSEFLRDLKDYGLQPRASDMVQLKIHGVTPEYLKGLKDAGFGDLGAQRITELRIHGVPTEFIRDSRALGYEFTPAEIVNLRIHGVDANYLRRLKDSGMRNLSAAEIEKLKIHGVD
jgi:hypothetical protein